MAKAGRRNGQEQDRRPTTLEAVEAMRSIARWAPDVALRRALALPRREAAARLAVLLNDTSACRGLGGIPARRAW